jgi:hypothetical protein
MKKPHHHIWNESHDLPACSVVPQPIVPLHALPHLVKTSIPYKETNQPHIHYTVISLYMLQEAQ